MKIDERHGSGKTSHSIRDLFSGAPDCASRSPHASKAWMFRSTTSTGEHLVRLRSWH